MSVLRLSEVQDKSGLAWFTLYKYVDCGQVSTAYLSWQQSCRLD